MGAVAEEKLATAVKSPQKAQTDGRPNRIIKKTREKKASKALEVDVVLEVAGNTSPESEDTQDAREKKSQGIVIDGRTYTCATCKTGHRVGICKHAKERPMTATHPPGRPPAGAPKKVICDCPKQCKCKKRDCKCARNCNCTQMMYMLVYVPAPGEEEAVEEKGTWKLGQQVMTDLKGNLLTAEQVRARQEQKESQKTQTPETRPVTLSTGTIIESRGGTPLAVESKPNQGGGCCKHKENVATRYIASDPPPQSGGISIAAADGCNCGHTCTCAFCPQHPNNSTSMNMARQQAMHFANQPYNNDPQSIVSFMPTLPQGASCMGGLPQFAISRFSQRPSFSDLQRTFPNSGYVIGYPIWSNRIDSAGHAMAPFPTQADFVPEMDIMRDTGLYDLHQPVPMLPSELPSLNFSQDEFGIGNAFVASAGPGAWNPNLVSPSVWSMDDQVTTPAVGNFMEDSDFLDWSAGCSEVPTVPMQDETSFNSSGSFHVGNEDSFIDMITPVTPALMPETNQHTPPRRSCCGSAKPPDPAMESHGFPEDYFSAVTENASPIVIQPQG